MPRMLHRIRRHRTSCLSSWGGNRLRLGGILLVRTPSTILHTPMNSLGCSRIPVSNTGHAGRVVHLSTLPPVSNRSHRTYKSGLRCRHRFANRPDTLPPPLRAHPHSRVRSALCTKNHTVRWNLEAAENRFPPPLRSLPRWRDVVRDSQRRTERRAQCTPESVPGARPEGILTATSRSSASWNCPQKLVQHSLKVGMYVVASQQPKPNVEFCDLALDARLISYSKWPLVRVGGPSHVVHATTDK